MPALQRDEAQTRARLIDVHRYEVALDLTQGEDHFGSRTVIHFTARDAGDTFVDIQPAELHTATLDGHPLDPAALADNRLPLTGLTPGAHELRLTATMRYSRTGEGMHRFTDPADGESYVYTQLFMEDVKRVFAAFDQPDLKAVFALTVTAPPTWHVLGNGIATQRDPGHWTLAPTPLISTYLVAVAAGPGTPYAPNTPDCPSASTAAAPWPRTSTPTPTKSSASPAAATTATTRSSTSPTPSTPTTRRSSPSSTPAPWRTPDSSPSATNTSSAPPSPTPNARPAA